VLQGPANDGTPRLDLKPGRCQFRPLAPPQRGDFERDETLPRLD